MTGFKFCLALGIGLVFAVGGAPLAALAWGLYAGVLLASWIDEAAKP